MSASGRRSSTHHRSHLTEYTRLGSSGLKVSRIALGTMGYGDLTLTDEEVTALEEPSVLRQPTWF